MHITHALALEPDFAHRNEFVHAATRGLYVLQGFTVALTEKPAHAVAHRLFEIANAYPPQERGKVSELDRSWFRALSDSGRIALHAGLMSGVEAIVNKLAADPMLRYDTPSARQRAGLMSAIADGLTYAIVADLVPKTDAQATPIYAHLPHLFQTIWTAVDEVAA